jgi:Flp pilus assembly protein TadD
VTLPGVLLLLDFWPLKRWSFGEWRLKNSGWLLEKAPFLALSLVVCVITILAQRKTVSSLATIPVDFRLENALTAYVSYLWKMIWPVDLTIFYPLQLPIALPFVAEAAVILAGISLIIWLERKGSPWLMVGWLWFLMTLLPVIGLVQVGAQAMADRYSYFPLVGIFLAVTFSAMALARRFNFLRTWLIWTGVLILGACLALTEKQLSYWRDSESLFTHATVVADSDVAHLCLANALLDQNRTSEAMNEFIRSLELNPGLDSAYDNLAKWLNDQGKTDLAIHYCQEAVKRKPKSAFAHINFGIMLMKLQRFNEATNEFLTAARLDVSDPRPQFLMGQLLLQQGRGAEAMLHLREALQIDPNDGQMLIFVASVLASYENPQIRNGMEARALAEKAVQLTHHQQPAVLDALAMSYAETGKFVEAALIEQQAIKLADEGGMKDDLHFLQKRLELYRQHQPWRDSFKTDSSKEMQTPDKIPTPK